MEIVINEVKRESEKAMLISVSVCWNDGNWHAKDIWFPKSVVTMLENGHILVSDWFAKKLQDTNAFNGYRMAFAMAF